MELFVVGRLEKFGITNPEHKHSGRSMIKLVGKIKSPVAKFVFDYLSSDIAEYEYDYQSALSTHKFKVRISNSKTTYVTKNIIFILITIFSVNS